MVTDYFLLRHTRLDSYSLYRRGGIYEYRNGINPAAIVALVAGVIAALIGKVIPSLAFLYDYAWFVGFFLSGAIYYLMMFRTASAQESAQ
jgi:NCS1 family nucleobase:cation symporter-1